MWQEAEGSAGPRAWSGVAGVAYCTLHFFITLHYSTVQYRIIKLRQVVVGESYSSSLEAEQLVQAVTGPRYPSAVQCSTVQYRAVCCRCTTVWRIGAAHLADLKHA